jgi:hypothetical protein
MTKNRPIFCVWGGMQAHFEKALGLKWSQFYYYLTKNYIISKQECGN